MSTCPPPGSYVLDMPTINTILTNYGTNTAILLWSAQLCFESLAYIKKVDIKKQAFVACFFLLCSSILRVYFWSFKYFNPNFMQFGVTLFGLNVCDLITKVIVALIYRQKALGIFRGTLGIEVWTWFIYAIYVITVLISVATYPYGVVVGGSFAGYLNYQVAAGPALGYITNMESMAKGLIIVVIDGRLIAKLSTTISGEKIDPVEKIYKIAKLVFTLMFMVLIIILCFYKNNASVNLLWIFANNLAAVFPLVQIVDFYKYDVKAFQANSGHTHQPSGTAHSAHSDGGKVVSVAINPDIKATKEDV
ncbi:hypothetical protein HK101_011485 [Irineochytrium annulatum]|nr:hypothetical protein HK101_011485 [Irineochytrium annulatum]